MMRLTKYDNPLVWITVAPASGCMNEKSFCNSPTPDIKMARNSRLANANTFSAVRTPANRKADWVNNKTSKGTEMKLSVLI